MENKRIDHIFVLVLFSLRMILFSKIAFQGYLYEKDPILDLMLFFVILYFIAPYLLIDYINVRTKKNHVYMKLTILVFVNIFIFMWMKPYNLNFSNKNINLINSILVMLFSAVNIIYLAYYVIIASKSALSKITKIIKKKKAQ